MTMESPRPAPLRPSDQQLIDRMNALPLTRLHVIFAVAVTAALFFDIYEIFLAGTLSAVLTADFGVTSDTLRPLLASSFLGAFVGALGVGRLADRYGRRRMFMISLALYSLASIACAFSPNVWFLVGFRFIAGMGIGAETTLADAYLADMLPARYRGKTMAWALTIAFLAVPFVGFLSRILVPMNPFGIDGWRLVFFIGGLGAAIIWFARRSLPESPRWLVAEGQAAQAEAVVARFEASPPFRPQEPPAQQPHLAASPKSATVAKLYTKEDLWRPPLRRRTIMMYIFHLLQGVGAYGFGTLVPLILVAKGQTITTSLTYTTLIYFGYTVGSLLSIPIIERVERKWMIVGTVVAMAVLGIIFGLSNNSAVILIAGFLYTAANNMLSSAYHTYQAEIFPTEVRGRAVGNVYSLSRLTTAIMPYVLLPVLYYGATTVMVNGKPLEQPTATAITMVFVIIALALTIVAAAVAILGPRTTGRTVEEISAH